MTFSTMNFARLCATVAVSIALGAGLIACGGGGDGGGGSDEDQITDLITNAVATSDETLCTESFSQGFVEEISGEKGDAAIEACKKSFKGQSSNDASAKVDSVKVDGDKATAEVTVSENGKDTDSSFDLVKEDGDWRIDSTN